MKWKILDWCGNDVFNGINFNDFYTANEFLETQIKKMYPEIDKNEKLFNEQLNEYQIIRINYVGKKI